MTVALIFAWCLQDFLQALFVGWTNSPDIFLMTLLTVGLIDETAEHSYIWIAFIGGLLIDLRWTGVPGMHGALFCAAYMISGLFWSFIPKEGRVPYIFLSFVAVNSSLVALFRWVLSKAGLPIGTASFGAWVLLTVPFILISWLYYCWFYRRENV